MLLENKYKPNSILFIYQWTKANAIDLPRRRLPAV